MIRKNFHEYLESQLDKESILYAYLQQRQSLFAQHLRVDAVLEEVRESIMKTIQQELEQK